MNEINPYLTPQVDGYTNHVTTEKLQGFNFNQIKKLYYRSCNVNMITFLIGFGSIILGIVSAIPNTGHVFSMKAGLVGLAVIYAMTVVGLFRRTAWGRILGIIVCVIFLIAIPIGTVIGISGLFAFLGAPELFGSNRVTHRELKSEFNLQKLRMKGG
jgi:hypothetical protein